jgi:hypothetical protein
MSEKIYACLLHLYPAKFRQAHGDDALQLFRDRLRDETGFLLRLRLWLDLFLDLAVSLPLQYAAPEPAFASASAPHTAGTPFFFVLEGESLPPVTLFSGCALTLAALSLVTTLLNQAGRLHGLNFGSTHSEFLAANPQDSPRTPAAINADTSGPNTKYAFVYATADSFAESQQLFPPPLNYLALTNVSANPNAQRVFLYGTPDVSTASGLLTAQAVNLHAPEAATSVGTSALDPERQRVLDAVVANLKQHYFDPAVAQQMADALVARQQSGDDAPATDGKTFAALLTAQMRDVSHDLHLEVVYNPAPLPQPTAEEFARMLAALQKDNCSFKKVQILPHNIGYLKLDAFLDPSTCGSTAAAAMASLNNADALIFDLRNNRGGTAEMVSFISSYLFDHPEYMFDPRRIPTPQSWTSSPVPGSKLANKPVFILTSSTTISAAEQFTYDLKMLKRATIVGETTAGGAHAGVWHPIDDHYGVAIPENRAVNPYSQRDWEATGIQPDIKVPAWAAVRAALNRAHSQLHGK